MQDGYCWACDDLNYQCNYCDSDGDCYTCELEDGPNAGHEWDAVDSFRGNACSLPDCLALYDDDLSGMDYWLDCIFGDADDCDDAVEYISEPLYCSQCPNPTFANTYNNYISDGPPGSFTPVAHFIHTKSQYGCVADCFEESDGVWRNPDTGSDIAAYTSALANYWFPDQCQCAKGYETRSEGDCFDCSIVDPGCISCDYNSFEYVDNDWYCELCADNNYMVSPDGERCIPKLPDCKVPLDEQPAGLEADDNNEYWICPSCKSGTFGTVVNGVFECIDCIEAMDHCENCYSGGRCVECENGWFPTYNQDGCQSAYANCVTAPDGYHNNGEDWVCPECVANHYCSSEDLACTPCPVLAGCDECMDATTCKTCSVDQILLPDKSGCVGRLTGCKDAPINYGVTTDHQGREVYFCNNCEGTNMFWDSSLGCTGCDSFVPGCQMCSRDGADIVCDKCTDDDKVPSPDGMTCQGAIPGCDNSAGAAGYDTIDGQYHCS